jgi:hypothetical protein
MDVIEFPLMLHCSTLVTMVASWRLQGHGKTTLSSRRSVLFERLRD